MRSTFQNAGMTLSIGLFFSIMVAGLSGSLSSSLSHGLTAAGLPSATAARVAGLPPVSVLFAAFLGYNTMRSLLGPALNSLPPARQATITGHAFFPSLIAGPFHHGLSVVFTFALIMCLVAAAASWLRGGTAVRAGRGGTVPGDLAASGPAPAEPGAAGPLAGSVTALVIPNASAVAAGPALTAQE
jgi:hypothetical protein